MNMVEISSSISRDFAWSANNSTALLWEAKIAFVWFNASSWISKDLAVMSLNA
jgi:hypothetical protein